MPYPYPRTDPSTTVERYKIRLDFDPNTATLTMTWAEGLKSEDYTYKGVYDEVTDYVADDLVWDTDKVWLCLVANGPGSTVHNPEEGTYWTATLGDVNDAGMPYHTADRVSGQKTFTWVQLRDAVTGELTEDQLLDFFYLQGGNYEFLGKVLYDALKAAGQEPLPDP